MNARNISRRKLLIGGAGLLAVGFLPGCSLPVIPKRPAPALADAWGWIRYDGRRYQLTIPRVEMGQNIATALKQVACQELDVEWALLDVQLHDTASIDRVRATVGSESIKDFAVPLAQACATLRDGIRAGLTQQQLKPSERSTSGLRAFATSGGHIHIGKSAPLEQGLAIVTGQPLYAADISRPGMLYGRVLRAGTSPEITASVEAFNAEAARKLAGFVAIVQDPWLKMGNAEGLGIVARTPGTLDRIEAALQVTWRTTAPVPEAGIDGLFDIDARLRRSSGREHAVHDDRVDDAGPWDVDLRIDVPPAAHAAMEPRACVAEYRQDGQLEMWVGTQDVFYQRDVVCKRLGLSEDKVRVHGMRVGGGFGGKTLCTVELEAALLARAVTGAVKVQWTRAQEFQLGFHRPASSHRLRARLAGGTLGDWWHSFAGSHILFTNAGLPVWLQRFTDLVGDGGVARGAQLPYRAKSRRTEYDLVRSPIYSGPWRGLGAGPNVFAIESAIDACARHANMDPVQFRLQHMEDDRLAGVLERVARIAAWGAPVPSRPGYRRGRGVACGIYKAMSYAAVVADIEVNENSAGVRVLQLWCAHDCGQVVNPDQVRAQCEGNLVWGLGMVLKERLDCSSSGVKATTFSQSPIPSFKDVPLMSIDLLDNLHAPTGAGETAIVASGAAIANAIHQATGLRVSSLPLDTALLRDHLRSRTP